MSIEKIKFSVAMSVYGKDDPNCLDVALKSITEDQTLMPDEIVLVEDGPVSTELEDVIAAYDARYAGLFKIIKLEKNQGLGNALKVAVKNASYEYIARMDSDDISLPHRFEEQVSYVSEHPETDIVGGDISEFIDTPDNIVGNRRVPQSHEQVTEYMKRRCAINHVTAMFKKASVERVGNYDDWFWNEDYFLWIRMMENSCIFANTGTILVNVRVGADMYKRRGGKKYFESEKNLQKYMLNKKIITRGTYMMNVLKRWVVQVAMPNFVRGWVFRTFARTK